ncbi:MAG TPA: hypothetical protein VLZ74_10995 [Methylocella sp.]|nr:hypothetical protein [Methylocella sp.]
MIHPRNRISVAWRIEGFLAVEWRPWTRHGDDEFACHFSGSIAPTSILGPESPYFARQIVCGRPFGPSDDDWDQACVGLCSLRNLHESADNIPALAAKEMSIFLLLPIREPLKHSLSGEEFAILYLM